MRTWLRWIAAAGWLCASAASADQHWIVSQSTLTSVVKAWQEGAFPFACRLEGTKTGQGYTTLCLREPGQAKAKGK